MTQVAVSEDIRALLLTGGFGLTDGKDVFSFEWGSDADGAEIDKQISIVDTDAINTDLKDVYEQPTFVISVRGDKSESGKEVHDRARAIYEFMIAQVTQTINSTDYLEFEPIGGLIALGRDTNSRFLYTMIFYTFRDPA